MWHLGNENEGCCKTFLVKRKNEKKTNTVMGKRGGGGGTQFGWDVRSIVKSFHFRHILNTETHTRARAHHTRVFFSFFKYYKTL